MLRRKKNPIFELIKIAILALIVFATIFPFYYAILNSFRHIRAIPDFGWLPTKLTLNNWKRSFSSESPVSRWLINSLIVTLSITTICVCLDSLAGYAFARKKFPGNNLLFFGVIIFGMTVPIEVLIIPIYMMMAKAHLLNTYIALILPAASSLGTFMIRQAVSDIPIELEEAAKIDGCSPFGIFFRIILPLLKPAIASIFIILFLTYWNNFLYPMIVTSKTSMRTLTVGLYLMAPAGSQSGMPPRWDIMTVIMATLFIPALIIFITFQKQFARGITMTGMK